MVDPTSYLSDEVYEDGEVCEDDESSSESWLSNEEEDDYFGGGWPEDYY